MPETLKMKVSREVASTVSGDKAIVKILSRANETAPLIFMSTLGEPLIVIQNRGEGVDLGKE